MRNITTNLNTHCDKHLTAYLTLRVFQFNQMPERQDDGKSYDQSDIERAVNWAIDRFDKVSERDINADEKRQRRDELIEMVREIGGPEDGNIGGFLASNWFKSLPLWLRMQSEVDEFHIQAEENNIRIPFIKT